MDAELDQRLTAIEERIAVIESVLRGPERKFTLPQRLTQQRGRCKMSQAELAKASGIAESRIADIENGSIKATALSPGTLLGLCGALGITPDFLLGR
jgi:DNA-binding XRE family transcriptional regulator